MHKLTIILASSISTLLLSSCGWFADNPAPLEPGYSYLFDNETLDGWHRVGGEATYAVDDGEIVGHYGPGDNSFLRTDRNFSNFNLKLDVKFEQPGNSGIMFRAGQRPEDGRTYGYQYEIDPSDRAWSGGIYDEARRGWIADLSQNEAARAALKLEAWNEVTIEAHGPRIKTWINGVLAADIIDGLDREGFIALQVHAGNEGIIHWRNIRIQELEGEFWDDTGLLSAAAWKTGANTELLIEDDSLTLLNTNNGPVSLASRRGWFDFSVNFSLPTCANETLIGIRGEHGALVKITGNEAAIKGSSGEAWGETKALLPGDRHTVYISAQGTELRVTIDETAFENILVGSLGDSGRLSISGVPCTDTGLALIQPRWADLREVPATPLFYQTLDTPPAPALSPEEALASFRIAPEFDIELVAAEPLVEDPVAMAWDADGNLYVVEMRGFMPDAYGDGQDEPVGRIMFLQDTNADGQMDTSQIFMDKLVLPRAVAVVNEGILIAEPPNLWLCKDTHKNHTCGEKIRLGEYASDPNGNLEHQENGLMTGLDNWLYNAKSERRMRIKNGELVIEPTLFRGQWGMTQDNEGRLYYNHNSRFILGDMFPAEYDASGNTGEIAAGLGTSISTLDGVAEEVFSIRVNPGVNRAYLDGTLKPDGRLAEPTAVSGLAYYRGQQFPDEYQNDIFVPEPGANVVAQFRLSEAEMAVTAQHITYADPQWQQREFLASTDERFRPVDAKIGPDGALYIIDMYRGIVQDQVFMTEQLREQVFERGLETPIGLGRIWRIKHSASNIDHKSPALAKASTATLLAALSSANGWTRDTAQRLLLQKADVDDALRIAVADGHIPAAAHALWILETRETLDAPTLQAVLKTGSPAVQLQALRAGLSVIPLVDLQQFASNLNSLSAKLAQQLSYNLAPFSASVEAQQTLLKLLDQYPNTMLADAVLTAVSGHENAFFDVLQTDTNWTKQDDFRNLFLQRLSFRSYLSLRGDITSTAIAPPALQELLDRIAAQTGPTQWRQVAMLSGLMRAVALQDFTPAQMSEAPALFADATIDETSPLWDARLLGRRAFTWPGDEIALGLKPLSPTQMEQLEVGKALYSDCANCHGDNGKGIAGLAPPLAASPWVTGPPEWLARTVLQGLTGPLMIDGVNWNGVMPAHQDMPGFTNEAVAGLLTHLRRSWGNRAAPVAAELVQAARLGGKPDKSAWTVAELELVPYETGFEKFAGEYKLSFVTITMSVVNNKLHMNVPMYGGGELTQLDDIRFHGETGAESVDIEFKVSENGAVDTLYLLRNGERLRFIKKQ